jgi:ABC-type transport system involved in Fe-S cluster assembly fused permease/ATPase subunit
MPLIKAQVTASLKYNIKEEALRHIIKLLIDFYNNKSSIEVIEVINLEKRFINFMDYLLFNTMSFIINIIIITVYLSHFINGYIGLIAIAVVVLQI